MPNSVFPGLHDRLAHGVACELALFRVKSPGHVRQRQEHPFCQLRQHAVGQARHGVLLVHRDGNAGKLGRHQRREGGIGPETDHGVRPEVLHDSPSHEHGAEKPPQRAHGTQAAPEHAAHGQPPELQPGLFRQLGLGTVLRTDEQQLGAFAPQLFRHGQSRKNMSTGSAGGQNDPNAHILSCHRAVREKFSSKPMHIILASRLLPP